MERFIGKYCVIRTYSAGIHCGYVDYIKGNDIILTDSRRIHYWSGACSISQMSADGIKNLEDSRIAVPVKLIALQWIEIIPCEKAAQDCIINAPEWKIK